MVIAEFNLTEKICLASMFRQQTKKRVICLQYLKTVIFSTGSTTKILQYIFIISSFTMYRRPYYLCMVDKQVGVFVLNTNELSQSVVDFFWSWQFLQSFVCIISQRIFLSWYKNYSIKFIYCRSMDLQSWMHTDVQNNQVINWHFKSINHTERYLLFITNTKSTSIEKQINKQWGYSFAGTLKY